MATHLTWINDSLSPRKIDGICSSPSLALIPRRRPRTYPLSGSKLCCLHNFTKLHQVNLCQWSPMRSSIFVQCLKKSSFRNGMDLNYELKSCKKYRQILWSKPWDTNGSFKTGTVHNLQKKIPNMRKLEGINQRFDAMIRKFTEKNLPMCLCKKELLAPILDNALSTFEHNPGHPFRFNLQIIGMKVYKWQLFKVDQTETPLNS